MSIWNLGIKKPLRVEQRGKEGKLEKYKMSFDDPPGKHEARGSGKAPFKSCSFRVIFLNTA